MSGRAGGGGVCARRRDGRGASTSASRDALGALAELSAESLTTHVTIDVPRDHRMDGHPSFHDVSCATLASLGGRRNGSSCVIVLIALIALELWKGVS